MQLYNWESLVADGDIRQSEGRKVIEPVGRIMLDITINEFVRGHIGTSQVQ